MPGAIRSDLTDWTQRPGTRFTDEETAERRGSVTCLQSCSGHAAQLAPGPRPRGSSSWHYLDPLSVWRRVQGINPSTDTASSWGPPVQSGHCFTNCGHRQRADLHLRANDTCTDRPPEAHSASSAYPAVCKDHGFQGSPNTNLRPDNAHRAGL